MAGYVRRCPEGAVGLSPEGRDFAGGVLGWPPPGSGRFIGCLARLGLKLCQAGIYEEDGILRLYFGPGFELQASPGQAPAELDRAVARQVTQHIARPFYEKMGYTVFGVLDDLPEGQQRIFLKKDSKG